MDAGRKSREKVTDQRSDGLELKIEKVAVKPRITKMPRVQIRKILSPSDASGWLNKTERNI